MTEPGVTTRPERPLLAAKYSIPPERSAGVVRTRLHEKLLGNASTRLTVVVAPAGWGKTTLLSQWAHDPAELRRVAWVSLDESDDEPTRFWTYVLTALGQHGLGADALHALGAPGLDPVDVVLPMLLNELESVTTEVVLVLDDYHVLSDNRLHEGVEFLLAYLPPALRLVLAGRADPPLPLPRLRARGDLTEIRMSDLEFSAPEAGQLAMSVGGVELDGPGVQALCERTEGWAAGVQLAALTLSRRTAPATVLIEEMRGDNRHILDFFASEVLPSLTPDQHQLLTRTSLLERLSGPLCDAVLHRTGSAAILAEVDQANLFVVPLDDRREWYRCHRLFRDALRHQLDPETSAAVLGEAADWFLSEGQLEDAIALKIEAADTSGAIGLLRASVPWFLQHGAGRILHLSDQLGFDDIRSDPRLCASLAWAAAVAGQFQRMAPWLDAAELSLDGDDAEPPPGWHTSPGAVLTLRAIEQLATSNVSESLTLAERGVEQESDPALPGYVMARNVLGTAYVADDRPIDALPILRDAWRASQNPRFPPLIGLRTAGNLLLALLHTGEYAEARRVLADSASVASTIERTWGDAAAREIARLAMVEGRLSLLAGDLAEAERLSTRAVALVRDWGLPSERVMALNNLAEVLLATRDLDAARAAVTEAREVMDTEPIWRFAGRDLDDIEARVGRGSVRAARRPGVLVEDLTDRELSILRMLPGSANQREMGNALFLSINTVKSYAKSLYRKLDVTTRGEAVERARELQLI